MGIRGNLMDKRLLILVVVLLGFLLGWLFPVEGPVDYIYDNYKVNKCATKNAPKQVEKLIYIFSEEEIEELEYELRNGVSQSDK